MTLIKSILLGSAAGVVAVASAQAADLPTRKAAPVEYVRVCNVGGITGWTLPGSDTCVKLSGFVTAQFVGGNLNTENNYGTIGQAITAINNTPGLGINTGLGSVLANLGGIDPRSTQRVLLAASEGQQNTTRFRNETGWSTRANVALDVASNTAYGPLIGHAELQGDVSNGLDPIQGAPVNNIFYVNTAYVTWAGITAGKAQSFFSFIGGGDNYANLFSPDRKGFNEPLLLAYTASFGGGFTATLSAESPASVGASGGGTDANGNYFQTNLGPGPLGPYNPSLIQFGGQKWPDIVGALHVKQGWGEAQVSGVIHNVNVTASGDGTNFDPAVAGASCGPFANVLCNGTENKVGWAVDAGVKINLTNGGWFGNFWGAGDDLVVSGAYSQSAIIYSGLNDGMFSENGQVNGNGQPILGADAFFNPATNQWSTPAAWSVLALLEHHWTPQFYTNLQASILGLNWSNQGGGCNVALPTCLITQAGNGALSPHAFSWIVGADLGWNPVTNLNFDFELMYQSTVQTAPSGFLGTVQNLGNAGGSVFVPGDWRGISDGFAGRLRITRYF